MTKHRGTALRRLRHACGLALLVCYSACAESQPQLTKITPTANQPVPAAPATSPAAAAAVEPGDVDRSQLPPPGPAPRINLPVPERMTLSNGTKVLVVERHAMPVVAMAMVWPVGGLEDPSDRPGMASLTADMMDEGAGDKGSLELADAFARLGSRISSAAGLNSTVVSVLTLSRNLDESLKLFGDVVRRPQLSAKELERVKNDTLTALKQRQDVPSNVAQDAYQRVLYGAGHRRAAPAQGAAEAVKLLDHLDLRWWHRERLRPDDATLIVVGDVTAAALKPKLEAEFQAWKAPGARKEAPVLPAAPPSERRVVVVDQPGRSQTVLAIGETSVPRSHPDYFPLLVMNSILGGQFNSRINLNLREKHGYAYGAYSRFAFDRDGGPFLVGASVKGATTKASVDEVLKELARLRQGGVDADEMQQSKDLLIRSLAGRFETVSQVASELAAIEIFKLPDNYLATYEDHIKAVTAAEVLRVAQHYLDPKRMTIVLVGDRKEVDKVAELGLGPITYIEAPKATTAPAKKPPAK